MEDGNCGGMRKHKLEKHQDGKVTKKHGIRGSESRPDNGMYGDGTGVPKSSPVDPAENRKTKNASSP